MSEPEVLYRPLNEITLLDRARYGGKAAHLGEALRLGCPVLPGVALSTTLYHRFMRLGGLQGEIASILSTMQPQTMIQCQAAEWAIRSAFEVRRLPEQLAEVIESARQSLGGGHVAVRSSATSEDSPQQSFVGQHESILGVATREEVVEAVLACWRSLFSAKAIAYAQHFGLDLLNSSMGVLIQPEVSPSSQGALFTVDPVTGNPDRFILEIQTGADAGMHVLDPYHRVPGEQPLWSHLRQIGLLLDEQQLMYYAIEWLIADGELFVIRARPVTGAPRYLPDSGVESGLGRGPVQLVSAPEITPRSARPYSWYHRSRNQPLNAAYYRHAHRLFAHESGRSDYYLSGYLYTRRNHLAPNDADAIGPAQEWSRRGQQLSVGHSLDAAFLALWRDKRPRLDALLAETWPERSHTEIGRLLRELMGLHEAFWGEYGRLGDSAQVFSESVRDLARQWLGAATRCDELVAVYDDVITRGREALCRLARDLGDERALEQYAHLHRHQYLSQDVLADWADLYTLAGRDEGRQAIHSAYEAWQSASVDLREENRRRQAARDALERSLTGQLRPWQRPLFRHILRLARRYRRDTLDCAEAIMLCRLLERELVHEIGHRLCQEGLASAPDDAGLLGAHELLDWLSAPTQRDEVIRLVIQRKELVRRWHRYAPPEQLGGAVTSGAPLDESMEQFVGLPISAGVAVGQARLVLGMADAATVLPGDVLVCPEPLFEYAPLLSIVSAVVAERGRLLDHAGVLLREYGIPAVFAVSGILRAIGPDDELIVHANEGRIYRRAPELTWEI